MKPVLHVVSVKNELQMVIALFNALVTAASHGCPCSVHRPLCRFVAVGVSRTLMSLRSFESVPGEEDNLKDCDVDNHDGDDNDSVIGRRGRGQGCGRRRRCQISTPDLQSYTS